MYTRGRSFTNIKTSCRLSLFVKKVMSFFGKIKNGIDKGVTSLRNSKIFKKKEKKETNENEPEITDTDIAIAKLKSEKRNINEVLRKVLVD